MRFKAIRLIACAAAAGVAAGLLGGGPAQARGGAPYPYTLVDPGTFGGPQSFLNLPAVPLTGQGALLGTADTIIADADYPNFNPFMVGFPDPDLVHAFQWQNGKLRDLGALPGNNSSAVFEVNDRGVGVGMSETQTLNPVTGWPEDNAVMFDHGQVIDLGTLPGGYESQAVAVNDRGQVAGFADNGTPDPFSGDGVASRAFIWQNGVMQDIGTLGGPDTGMDAFNGRGQIAGHSFTTSTPNPSTGVPTQDLYLWTNGDMRDLGTLGGTIAFASWLNDAGEMTGASTLAGDQTMHPILWDGNRLIDLGTLGGQNGSGTFLNARGDVTGNADLPDGTHHAFLGRNGRMRDLPPPPVPGAVCSNGHAINDLDDVVGNATDCHGHEVAAVLWRHGVAYDLNTVIAPSPLHLDSAEYISDQGEIVGLGTLPNGNQHVYLLRPDRQDGEDAQQPSTARWRTRPSPVTTSRAAPARGRECAAVPASVHGVLAASLCPPE